MTTKKKPMAFINRELSWLEFNQRVLEEGKKADNPLLERLKFLAITASNLDEFFMVRVGGLHMARKLGRRKKDPSGRTPVAQLRETNQRAKRMMGDLHRCFNEVISPALQKSGIQRVMMDQLTAEQEAELYNRFSEELYPVITPIAVGPEEGEFPLLQGLALHLLVHLRSRGAKGTDCYAVVSLNRCGDRIIKLAAHQGFVYALLEDVVTKFAAHWFPGYDVQECAAFRITRNADFAVREEEAPDLLSGMEDVLEERKVGECIRLEVDASISKPLKDFLCEQVSVDRELVYEIPGVLNLTDFMPMSFMEGFEELKVEAWPPQPSPDILPNEPMFDQIAQRDLLLYHPYETFDPVVRFIEEAAADPHTLAMKMVLYRTSAKSAIISALKTAAENGINVTVLMELKARFDEARNMEWARDLEQCGVQVIHGVKGFKTHAKICLVVRRESTGIVRYCHFGTGNYNESTARIYGDVSYLTSNPSLGSDASAFFNALCGYAQPQHMNLISMAPIGLRDRLIELIDAEIERAQSGKKARICAKVNAIVDPLLIEKLHEASAAGVEILLNVRGICCLSPEGRIEVRSIVDRYLEHARIIYFHHGGKPLVFISSADWMPRNLDKRLELLVPIEDNACRDRLIKILETHLADNQNSWTLRDNGSYQRCKAMGQEPVRSQEALYIQACEAIEGARRKRRTRFEPHRTSDDS